MGNIVFGTEVSTQETNAPRSITQPSLQSIADPSGHPVNNIQWLDVNDLTANDYNPNHVMEPEMQLLALSLLKQKWIQPILVWPDPKTGKYVIIDGYHRTMVVRSNKQVWAMTNGRVPVVIMEMTVPDRMLLTIRINRAKGNHAAIRMHAIVHSLINDWNYSPDLVATEIGADISEINTLVAENVFEIKKVDEMNYSKSWFPKSVVEHGMEFE
jgi:ParB-like chromosome segregation protein Spo0J